MLDIFEGYEKYVKQDMVIPEVKEDKDALFKLGDEPENNPRQVNEIPKADNLFNPEAFKEEILNSIKEMLKNASSSEDGKES